jgi:hypothetical protein
MILLLSVTEADCLDRQHRRVTGATNRHQRRRSAYRASGLVLWPVLDDWFTAANLNSTLARPSHFQSYD